MKLGLSTSLIAVAAVAFVACSDSSGALSLEEYFAELETIDTEADAAVGALFADFPEGTEEEALTDDANLPFFKSVAAGFPEVVGDFLVDLKALDPPSEVEDAHNDLIGAGEDLMTAFEQANEAIQDAETMGDFMSINNELEPGLVAPASDHFDATCLDLVAIGEENGIDVSHITCVDE